MSADLKVAVVGAGSWGTAFATIPARNGVDTVLWARRQDLADAISSRHECPDYLPGIALPESLRATHDMEEALSGARIVMMAIPSHAFREVLKEAAPHVSSDASMLSLTKGLEQGSQKRMSELMQQEIDLPPWAFGTLTGPNLAKEIASGQPAAAVIGCEDEEGAEMMQRAFMSPAFRVYTNTDVVGCELGGSIKNVIAIASGIGDGMGFGDNSKAALITRGFAEMARLGVALGGKALTFAGLAGMGDLIATCTSVLSRNRHVGEQLGKGRKIDEIIAEMNMVAEGVKTSQVVVELADRVSVPMPIAEHVVKVVHEGMSPEEALLSLMTREAEPEFHGLT
jgi:glycerol-3-phosphate dehydrogenase (NAD(P)+)